MASWNKLSEKKKAYMFMVTTMKKEPAYSAWQLKLKIKTTKRKRKKKKLSFPYARCISDELKL